ncbi:hypothetical protein [Streptomyces xantholiticus]|uniref:Uncharacterized protein n=1 Tax=Streptomyces xantholiticus TaxID=68285 RepID=A0ABV1V044_9ACTN
MTEQSKRNEHPVTDLARPYAGAQPATVAALVGQRLEESPRSDPVKALLPEALGEGETREVPQAGSTSGSWFGNCTPDYASSSRF